MSWVGPRKTDSRESIVFEGRTCNTESEVWNAFHKTFNSAQDRPIDLDRFGDTLEPRETRPWHPFSKCELLESLAGCSGRSAPGPDHVTWRHLKSLVQDSAVTEVFLWIANACLSVGYWPQFFKTSRTVIIPKPGKPAYDVPKAFRPIVLLNTQIGRAHV